jgi:kanamycin nucleotidyltransferase
VTATPDHFWAGPQPHDTAQRRAIAQSIVQQAQTQLSDRLLAAALYGSVAKGLDQPYSDLEMFLLVEGDQEETYHEWVWEQGRIEVNEIGWDAALEMADTVEDDWPLARGQFVYAEPIWGDAALIDELKRRTLNAPKEQFDEAMQEILSAELYENLGKLRNAHERRIEDPMVALAGQFAHHTATLIALSHRHCFKNSQRILREALGLPDPPEGFDLLARIVTQGRLSDLNEVAHAIEGCWRGLRPWTEARGISIEPCLQPWPSPA